MTKGRVQENRNKYPSAKAVDEHDHLAQAKFRLRTADWLRTPLQPCAGDPHSQSRDRPCAVPHLSLVSSWCSVYCAACQRGGQRR